ncbi:MAG TPA: hypothetical protein VI756_28245, partial [Blastocatellia bacterium]
ELIEARNRGWLNRARSRTEKFRAQGLYKERAAIWSEVKDVYLEPQGASKCAYCERKLESAEYGKAELDIEHFRPKKRVRPWRGPKSFTGHDFSARFS